MMLRRVLPHVFGKRTPVSRTPGRIRLKVECLEDRSLPSTFLWIGTTTAWGTASNWSPNGVPGANDTALFEPDNGGSDADCDVGSATVASIQMDSSYDGVFTSTGGLTVSGLFFQYGTLDVTGATSVGTMGINGELHLEGTTLTCTNFVLYATGDVVSTGGAAIIGQSYDDVGDIEVASGVLTIHNDFTASAGSETTVDAGYELAFTGATSVSISGTLTLDGGCVVDLGGTAGGGGGGASLTIGGTLDVTGGNAFGGGDITQDGTLDFTDVGGTFDTLGTGGYNWSQTSNAITTMNIGAAGGHNDVLGAAAMGTVSLAGTLNVEGDPAGAGTWDLFTGHTVTGGFATQNLPDAPTGLEWSWGITGGFPESYEIELAPPP